MLHIPLIVHLSLDTLIHQLSDILFVENQEETLNFLVSQMRKNANSRKPLLSTRKKKMREKTLFKASTASLIRVSKLFSLMFQSQYGS